MQSLMDNHWRFHQGGVDQAPALANSLEFTFQSKLEGLAGEE